jgi:hypothetical protein
MLMALDSIALTFVLEGQNENVISIMYRGRFPPVAARRSNRAKKATGRQAHTVPSFVLRATGPLADSAAPTSLSPYQNCSVSTGTKSPAKTLNDIVNRP